jgi:V/A-type H+-transporting ATPase subunit I
LQSLVVVSSVYGVLAGSYFGVSPTQDSGAGSWLAYLHVLDINDFNTMMKLAIGVGVLHLILANAMVAWIDRRSLRLLAPVGWIGVIGCSYLLWLEYLAATAFSLMDSAFTPKILIGFMLILLFSSDRKITRITDLWWRLLEGFRSLYGLTSAFGDVLSYMRLFALGLSSASLAVTFNNLAVTARDAVPAGGEVLFVLILLFGHGLNFALGIMSGVIHGLRLNLLEFYNWGIKGEGYPFNAFKKRGRF